jgi:alkanesulfonate monooxygenase SsuD/methylene tetrahydromethanopterin reductase-like flavin-dependent oxidoreductase (luciferase family)
VVTGCDEREFDEALTQVRRLSKTGGWESMAGLVDDEMLSTFAVVGEPKDVGAQIVQWFSGVVDRFTLDTPYPLDEAAKAIVVEGVKSA